MKFIKKLFFILSLLISINLNAATLYLSSQSSDFIGSATFIIDPVEKISNFSTNIINLTYTKYSTNIINSTNNILKNIVIDQYITNSIPITFSLIIEAENGVITAPFIKLSNSISNSIELAFPSGGLATYQFYIPTSGSYKILASVDAVSLANNSFYVNIDSLPSISDIWDINPITVGFENRYAALRGNGRPEADQFDPRIFVLSQGIHNLYILGRESKVRLDKITILSQ